MNQHYAVQAALVAAKREANAIAQWKAKTAELTEELTFYRQRTESLQATVERQATLIAQLRRQLIE